MEHNSSHVSKPRSRMKRLPIEVVIAMEKEQARRKAVVDAAKAARASKTS